MAPHEDTVKKKVTCWCIDKHGRILSLKKKHPYHYQVQGQLHISKRKFCLFCVWTLLGIEVQRVERDDEFWRIEMLPQLMKFYNHCLLPGLVDPRHARSNKTRDPKYAARRDVHYPARALSLTTLSKDRLEGTSPGKKFNILSRFQSVVGLLTVAQCYYLSAAQSAIRWFRRAKLPNVESSLLLWFSRLTRTSPCPSICGNSSIHSFSRDTVDDDEFRSGGDRKKQGLGSSARDSLSRFTVNSRGVGVGKSSRVSPAVSASPVSSAKPVCAPRSSSAPLSEPPNYANPAAKLAEFFPIQCSL
ncbi:hypothetical protein PR048_009823 [Dryococelus australis]|uniref:Uncharacterized protein n=1 Tax=Dryococelus australis TaxID=614101 RepID=A0ABQ9I0Y2_9NEOP|nr:hypothetical protein PR048_009823 [Dryococelus australis]